MQGSVFCYRLVLFLFTALIAVPACAEGAAVASINGKVQGVYGNVDGDELEASGLSLTLPLGPHAGVQLDGAYGELGEDQLKGVALHLFTRNPESYLLGVIGAHAELQDVDLNRVGFEGEFYTGPLTMAAFLGQQLGDLDHNFFGTLDLHWYPSANLMLSLGGSLADTHDGRLHLGAEYQILTRLSAYVDFAVGENHYEHALVGLRVYFGGQRNLIQRHREDDPANPVVSNVLQGLNSLRTRQQEIALARGR